MTWSLKCLPRGKCNVTLLNETDVLVGYLDKEVGHPFFFFLLRCLFFTTIHKTFCNRVECIWWAVCLFFSSSSSSQDCFFYSLVFDPVQKTLLADQGEIRVGSKYQAEIPDKLAEGKPGDAGQTNGSRIQPTAPGVYVLPPRLRRIRQPGPGEAGDQGVGPWQPAQRPSDRPVPRGSEVTPSCHLSPIAHR